MQHSALASTASGPTAPTDSAAAFAGFWRRVAAFAVDAAALALVGHLLGLVFADAFARAGEWGRVVGFAVALAAFVFFDSRLGGGRTPGKRLLGLRAARQEGQAMGPLRAAGRATILLLPFFLNGAPLPAAMLFGPGVYLVSLLVFGVGCTSLYLFAFDRRTHRALHDRLTGTAVFRSEAPPDTPLAPPPPLATEHQVAVAALVALALAAPLAMRHLVRNGPLEEIARLYAAVTSLPGVRFAGVSDSVEAEYGLQGTQHEHVVRVDAVVDADVAQPGTLPERLAAVVFAAFPAAAAADRIDIELRHGFDIGIASHYDTRSFDRTPAQWIDRIAAGAGQ